MTQHQNKHEILTTIIAIIALIASVLLAGLIDSSTLEVWELENQQLIKEYNNDKTL